ncbi:major facilitator superfamily domain-containing protein [Gigaspora rosea]|uniref:Major facilitator superfamily domain-containing protein n=1 Tax=Gigaspora rosea TaxID=44941 RepID=A0A397VCI7_9GLOM|nr:major facilitator superfamily domain-containing protein [Gigaspora rosea]
MVPPEEQSRAVSVVSVSHFVGMIIIMPISNLLGSNFGWESIFWVPAIVGFIWSIIWYFYGRSDPEEYPGISKEELEWILKNKSTVCSEDNFGNYQSGSREHTMIIDNDHRILKGENDRLLPNNQISLRPHYVHKVPWKLLFSRREVNIFNEYFDVDIHLIGTYTALPYLSYTIMGSIAGYICDYAIHQLKFHVLTVTYLAKTSLEGLLMMTIGFALYSFRVSSFMASHFDIAPKYAGIICGIRNTFGMVPAFFGVTLTGWILDITANNWRIIWIICSLFNIIGTTIFLAWAGGEVIID